MYMADTVTDPRWFRGSGTFGEDPEFNARAIGAVVRGFQGEHGLAADGVAMTTKHFPGGGARENGFDPHYAEGKFNVYPTPGSLATYHLPPFQAAIDAGTSSVMPYYAIPSAEKSAMPQAPLEEFEDVGFAVQQAESWTCCGRWVTAATSTPTPGSCPRWRGASRSSACRSASARPSWPAPT